MDRLIILFTPWLFTTIMLLLSTTWKINIFYELAHSCFPVWVSLNFFGTLKLCTLFICTTTAAKKPILPPTTFPSCRLRRTTMNLGKRSKGFILLIVLSITQFWCHASFLICIICPFISRDSMFSKKKILRIKAVSSSYW